MGKEKSIKALLLMLIDISTIVIAYILSFYIRYGISAMEDRHIKTAIKFMPMIIVIYIVSLICFKMYNSIWRIAGIDEVLYGAFACGLAGAINFAIMSFVPNRVPRMVTVLSCLFITMVVLMVRLSYRFTRRVLILTNGLTASYGKNVLIIGAGVAGRMLISEIRSDKDEEYNIVGLIDDDRNKRKTYLNGIKVLGNRQKIKEVVKKYDVDYIFIAIPSATNLAKKEIIDICKETKVKVKIIPGVYELLEGKASLKQMREVDLKDLLGRDEVKLDKEEINKYIKGKTVLVTGGGGSIGSELCRQIAKFNPKKLVILDIYENNAYDLQNELNRRFKDLSKDVVIASVRDRSRLEEIFKEYNPEIIFHAAAHKHVPLMEFSPNEAIKNNVVGTLNIAECAHKFGAEKFVLISTDKAVNPTNVMGATKRMCEMIVQAYDSQSKTEFVAVRFGNVLGSNGSVIPLFKKQIAEGGPVTLTHKNITRYFMLIPEAAQLVLQAGAFAEGGEIFVLDMGKSVKIYDLAENLIKLSGYEPHKDIKIEVTGLRPGEKLYEELLMDEEGLTKTRHEKIFIGKPGEFKLSEVKRDVAKLLNASISGDKQRIKDMLKEVVPTYKEPNHHEIIKVKPKELISNEMIKVASL